MKVLGIIPARYASSRFPGKPLADIAGKPMIRRVYESALATNLLSDCYVATDDQRIYDCVLQFGGKVIMTAKEHRNGTERCAEAVRKLSGEFDVVVNIQGDEPVLQREHISSLCSVLKNTNADISSLCRLFSKEEDVSFPGYVKVVTDLNGRALYFSRAAIPFNRSGGEVAYSKHIGMYAFRPHIVQKLAALKPAVLEMAEELEQLRWLEHGFSIYIAKTTRDCDSVDYPEDIDRLVKKYFSP